METKEIIQKIDALMAFAADMAEKHDTTMSLARPKYLENLPVAQFVELCEHYPHDHVSMNNWPSTWLMLNKSFQVAMTCERVKMPAPVKEDGLEKLRSLIPQEKAA